MSFSAKKMNKGTSNNQVKGNVTTFFRELLPVIVGILVALYINNWNEHRKDKAYIDKISSSIAQELTETNTDIVEIMARQKSLVDTLDFYATDSKISILDVVRKNNGIYIPSIKINSWKAISNSKIELMEYDKISALATMEEQKETLKMKSDRFADFVYTNPKETEKDKKEFMKILMLDIIGSERSLQNLIQRVKEIDQKKHTENKN